ncbi:methylated-DNA-[protein]-cysteine S-methyltransferase [Bacillus oleivorans]|uniref:methylated-DNA--[protein]-cysteine S-methyltransferase n=1 Tax=Bacillus oleivorans TaxID=1448271 RepID=A0A285CLS3_9BACI|nr:methylated-DNA--[protein]-cysteine S-methyltransferase [Bacillus oleivorans]SNX68487.1 methylated-DNA-[protein]-cysteine S-methyltransferase [Bacillus oleivorans]
MAKNTSPIYWTLLNHKDWNIPIAASGKGLVFVGFQHQPFQDLSAWVEKHFRGTPLIENHEKLLPYRNQLIEYLQGERKDFSLPLDYKGTPFQREIWKSLNQIPYGQTRSYSDIANAIGKPSSVRAVGTAIGANPILISIPCHRVIGKNGTITGYRGGWDMKIELLELERKHSVI